VALLLPLLACAAQIPGLTSKPAAKSNPSANALADPLGRGTPHGTVLGFLHAAQDENYSVAAQYFQPATGHHRLDPKEEQDLAAQLLAVINQKILTSSLESLSDDPQGRLDDGLPPNQELLTGVRESNGVFSIALLRLDDDHGNKLWYISRKTLDTIPETYDSLKFSDIEKKLPSYLTKHRFLSMPLWQWIAILLALPLAARPSALRPALRSLLCATHSDWERFDDIFEAFWRGRGLRQTRTLTGSPTDGRAPLRRIAEAAGPQGPAGLPDHVERRHDGDGPGDGRGRREGASRFDNLAATDMRHIVDPADVAQTHALAARLARVMRARLVRRERIHRRGRRLDLRRTIHRSVSHGGTPVDLAWRRRKTKPLRLVVLLDASGSMSLYTAFFVRFLHGVVDSFREAEAFVFHTRLAHVSASLRDRDVARAVDRLALMAQGIGGGTRIGESLATFNRWHARRVIHSRTAVMIVSDGYDTGEPAELAAQMRRLRRRCRRIIWLNPLIGWRDYAPRARGMQAALPYVDLFAPAHNLASLAALEPYLARI